MFTTFAPSSGSGANDNAGDKPAGSTDASWLTGRLLVAMPSMADPRFEKSVIFICAHDANGAMGIVINNEMTHIPISLLLAQLSLDTDDDFDDFPVLQGGPVETARGLLLHTSDVVKNESIRIDRDFAVTGTIDALREIVAGEGPSDKLFALGYAGWSGDQLEGEIAENAWLVVDSDPELVFRTPAAEKWQKALKKLGVDPAFLSGEHGRA